MRTENFGGYEHRNVTAEQYAQADANDPHVARQKQHVMEHVADMNAPPVVEFIRCCMEFHPNSHMPPNGQPIEFDLNTRGADGQLKQQ